VKLKILFPLAATLVASPLWAIQNPGSLSLSTSALSFNGSSGNDSSQPLTVTVTGSQPVTIRSIAFSNSTFFTPSVALPVTLSSGQSYTGQISAHAQSTAQTGTLTVGTDAGTVRVSLTETAAQAPSTHTVALAWQKPTDGYNVVGYDVDRAASGSSSFSQVGSTPGGTLNWTDSSVQAGQTYVYRVRSVGDGGDTSDPSNTVTLSIP
jgi:hypothetical protein